MGKVVLQGFIQVPSKDLDAVRRELPRHQSLTRAEEGCLVFNVSEADTTLGRFEVYEEFVDRQAFEYHQRRAAASQWSAVAASAERHYEIREDDTASGKESS